MKGRNYRRPLPSHNHARIIQDSADSTQDKLVPLGYALEEYYHGRLVAVDLGPSFPNSFMRPTNARPRERMGVRGHPSPDD